MTSIHAGFDYICILNQTSSPITELALHIFADDDSFSYSDSDDDSIYLPRQRQQVGGESCDWCKVRVHVTDLTLLNAKRQTKTFCSQDCLQKYKDDHISKKVSRMKGAHTPHQWYMFIITCMLLPEALLTGPLTPHY